jgi:kynurenine 3-monooxygenase
MKQKIIIIGSGLAGSLLGIYLSKRDLEVEIYEARGDMRKTGAAGGRSINLALSDRGIAALRDVGMDEYMLREAVPMRGRMIHALDGTTKLLPYSGRQGEYINSISRAGLNIALMNEAQKSGVKFRFNQKCVNFHSATGTAIVESATAGGRRTIRGDVLIATDGSTAACRVLIFRKAGSNTATKNYTFRPAKTAIF